MSSMDSQHVGFDLAIWAISVALGRGSSLPRLPELTRT